MFGDATVTSKASVALPLRHLDEQWSAEAFPFVLFGGHGGQDTAPALVGATRAHPVEEDALLFYVSVHQLKKVIKSIFSYCFSPSIVAEGFQSNDL